MKKFNIQKFLLFKNTYKYAIPLSSYVYKIKHFYKHQQRIFKVLLILSSLRNSPEVRSMKIIDQEKLALEIEKSCYNYTVNHCIRNNYRQNWDNIIFRQIYDFEINEKCYELNYDNNKYLIRQILNKKINPNDIGGVSASDINPSVNLPVYELINLRKNITIDYKYSTLYECEKCGKNETKAYEVQLRSSDEGKDLSLECKFCGFKWILRN